VHLAAMNRHESQAVLRDTNIDLVQRLINALQTSGTTPHVLFSSSTQEERDNDYGISKNTGRKLLADWAAKNGAVFTGMIIPNVYGPFGKPFYNSVVATFCHQLCNGQQPRIDIDGRLKLIYVDELAEQFIDALKSEVDDASFSVPHTVEKNVSEILEKLNEFRELYLDSGIFPAISNEFERNLFNTFRSYIPHDAHFPVKLKPHGDDRGVFVELVKLQQGGQVSYSTTHAGITRGNHFHTRKIERFLVIKGKALIQLRKYNTDEVIDLYLDGEQPSYVDMPVWYTHNIKNIGEEELYTVFWINEFFDPADPDTFFETV
jgi:UDP-2-acetamido-2,6-beta-L-arabino-hexul-4-ose reductase